MDGLLAEFIAEAQDYLNELDQDLVELEKNPDEPGLIDKIFRIIHTIKGTSGFVGLDRLGKVSHATENVLGQFRDKKIEITSHSISVVLRGIDVVRIIVEELAESGQEPDGDDSQLIADLDACLIENGGATAPEASIEEPVSEEAEVEQTSGIDDDEPDFEKALAAAEAELEKNQHHSIDDEEPDFEKALAAAEAELEKKHTSAPEAKAAAEPEKKEPAKPITTKAPSSPKENTTETASAPSSAPMQQTIRVNLETLDTLMTTVSELVLTRNQLLQIILNEENPNFEAVRQKLNMNVSELQESVMKTRMQPISTVWDKFPRVIRDLATSLNKKINLVMEGKETELDRQIIELIRDPLTHMVRNSADHGIEGPEDRLANGKPEEGTLALRAYHEGGHIVIEIDDDGKGLDPKKIGEKAIEKGLITEDELETKTDKQLQQFIFAAGFSTAAEVTAVSGRGVGMDVVRSNIEKIGGSLDMNSVPGKGTTFYIKIPLTLAIVPALIIGVREDRFAIPQINIEEIIKITPESSHKIEKLGEQLTINLRKQLIPVLNLEEMFFDDNEKKINLSDVELVIIRVGVLKFGICVSKVFNTEEVVVKGVSDLLSNISIFSGNTILGDGSVIMILDPGGMANIVSSSLNDIEEINKNNALHDMESHQNSTRLLVFKAYTDVLKAVPVSSIERIEEFPSSDVEYAEGKQYIQYRDELMPIYSYTNTLFDTEKNKTCRVIVFRGNNDQYIGLHVSEIVDIAEQVLDMKTFDNQPGIMGSAVIDGKVTEVVDLSFFINSRKTRKKSTLPSDDTDDFQQSGGCRILCLDDSHFIRNSLEPILLKNGYAPSLCSSANQARSVLEKVANIELIITDIEMPEEDGFSFAASIKKNKKLSHIPIVAFTSLEYNDIKDKIAASGIDHFVNKNDIDDLINAINSYTSGDLPAKTGSS